MNKHLPLIINIALLLIGFFIGQISQENDSPTPIHHSLKDIREISVVQLIERKNDGLSIEVSGPVRITWNDSMVEGDGQHQIPLGQIPNENDRAFETFPYTGNSKTMKFYPSSTHVARGTHYQHRRFFNSKQAAIEAGFVASKLVKD